MTNQLENAASTAPVAKVTTQKYAKALFRIRCDLGLSQGEFSDRFGLPFGTVKNIEQGRFSVTPATAVLLSAIELDPVLMARAAQAVTR